MVGAEPGWALPVSHRVRRKMATALRAGGAGRTKRLRKKRLAGLDRAFTLHVDNGGYLP